MRAIVHVGKNSNKPVELIRHIFRPHARGGDEVCSNDRVAGIINGLSTGGITRCPKTDLESLIANHHGRGRKVRHVVLSIEDTTGAVDRRKAFLALARLARCFTNEFCAGADFFGTVHQDRRHPHLHLVISNSDGRRTLEWGRKVLQAMQNIEQWAPGLGVTSGRGNGVLSSDPGRSPYPLIKKSRVNDLAEMLFNEPGGFKSALLSGEVYVGRRNREGKILSLEWQGQRFRVKNLLRVAMGMGMTPFDLETTTPTRLPTMDIM